MQGQSDHQGKAIFGLGSDQNAKIFQILILLFLLYVGVSSVCLFLTSNVKLTQIYGPSVYRDVSLVATCDISISLMYQRSNNGNTRSLSWTNSFHFRIAQICLLPHTIWATFCTVCGEKKPFNVSFIVLNHF